jgi:hypothetical protein
MISLVARSDLKMSTMYVTEPITQVFSIRAGEYKLLLDGVMVPAEWNSKGAAEAAIPVERLRREKIAAKKARQ